MKTLSPALYEPLRVVLAGAEYPVRLNRQAINRLGALQEKEQVAASIAEMSDIKYQQLAALADAPAEVIDAMDLPDVVTAIMTILEAMPGPRGAAKETAEKNGLTPGEGTAA